MRFSCGKLPEIAVWLTQQLRQPMVNTQAVQAMCVVSEAVVNTLHAFCAVTECKSTIQIGSVPCFLSLLLRKSDA